MAEIGDLSILDANNTARWTSDMKGPQVNNAGQADEGLMARWFKDQSGQVLSTGTGAAYQVTLFRSGTDHAALGRFMFRAHVAGTGAATIAVNGAAAVNLRRQNGDALVVGDILVNQMVDAVWNSAAGAYWCLGITA